MAIYVATDRKGLVGCGHSCFVLSRAERPSVIAASDTPVVVSTNLKSDAGKTEDSPRDWIKLEYVNVSLVGPKGRTNLCEYSPILNTIVESPFCRSAHKWRVFF